MFGGILPAPNLGRMDMVGFGIIVSTRTIAELEQWSDYYLCKGR